MCKMARIKISGLAFKEMALSVVAQILPELKLYPFKGGAPNEFDSPNLTIEDIKELADKRSLIIEILTDPY